MGRKGRYKTEIEPRLHIIESWRRAGLTEKEICKKLHISEVTMYRYKNDHPEIIDALKFGFDESIKAVEGSLFKKAMGYDYEETKMIIDGDRKKIEKIKKHMPPDTASIIFYLKNRACKDWHDRKEHEITGKDGDKVVFKVMHVNSEGDDVEPAEDSTDK